MFQLNNKIWKIKNAYVLVTELSENERMIQEFAENARNVSPNDFVGERLYVYHKMNYIEPYKEFNELKKLQVAVKSATGMRANFKGIVAIDVQEWLGHFKEEYFLVTLKFFYDQLQHGWRYVFTLGNNDREDCKDIVLLLARYFKPYIVEVTPFGCEGILEKYVQKYMEETGKVFTRDTQKKFVTLLLSIQDNELKDLELIKNIVNDIAESTNKKIIGSRELKMYLTQGDSLVNLLMPSLVNSVEKEGVRNEWNK